MPAATAALGAASWLKTRLREATAQTVTEMATLVCGTPEPGSTSVTKRIHAETPFGPVTVITSPAAIPFDAQSPSFARSGILSPSFRGPIVVTSPLYVGLFNNTIATIPLALQAKFTVKNAACCRRLARVEPL